MVDLQTISDVGSILNGRTKRLNGFSYPLNPGGGQYGLDFVSSGDEEIDETEMSFVLPFASGIHRDSVGDLLEVGGIDISRHKINPLALWNHGKEVVLPIGLTENREQSREYTVSIDPVGQLVKAKVYLYQGKGMSGVSKEREYEHALFVQQLFDLWCKKLVRAGSLGYTVIQAKHLPPDYTKGIPAGLHLQKVLMLEASVVVLPANMETVRKGFDPVREILSMPKICGYAPSPYLIKSLQPYAQDTKTVVGFGDIKSIETQLAQIGKESKNEENIGYGNVFWHPEKKEVWYSVGDWAEPEYTDPIRSKLESISGVDKVTVEAESSPPKNEGWVQVYPKQLDWVETDSDRQYKYLKSLRNKYRVKGQPADKIDPKKACTILKDGQVHGKPLTEKQTGMFGAACGKKSEDLTAKEKETWEYCREKFPMGDRRMECVEGKAINVRYKQKVIKGYAEVSLKFDLTALDLEKQNAFVTEMETQGYGRPKQGRWGGEKNTIQAPLRIATFCFDVKPESEQNNVVAEAIRSASEIANRHGARYLGNPGSKSLTTNKDKSMSAQVKTKGMGDGNGMELAEEMGTQEINMKEPYGAQFLRQLYDDHSIIMRHYDSLLGPLEPDSIVRKYAVTKLQNIEKDLTEMEKLFGKHYKDISPLGGEEDKEMVDEDTPADEVGGETKDLTEEETEDVIEDIQTEEEDTEENPIEAKDMDTMEDPAVDADGNPREDELPTPEEAVEGMRKEKGLYKEMKTLRKQYKSKEGKDKETSEGIYCKLGQTPRETGCRRNPKWHEDGRKRKKGLCPACEKAGKSECVCGTKDHYCSECGKDPCICDEKRGSPGEVGTKIAPLMAAGLGFAAGQLLGDKDMSRVKEGSSWLNDVSQPESKWDEDERHRAYHYGKTFEGISDLEEAHEDLEKTPAEQELETEQKSMEDATEEKGLGKVVASAAKNPKVRGAVAGAARGAVEGWQSAKEKGIGGAAAGGTAGSMIGGALAGPVGSVVGAGLGAATGDKLTGKSAKKDLTQDEVENITNTLQAEEADTEPKPQRKSICKMCKDVSGWFNELAKTPELSEDHRQKSARWHKEIEEALNSKEEIEEDKTEENLDFEPGEIGEKDLDIIRGATYRQNKVLDDLLRQVDGLNERASLGMFGFN